MKPLNFISLHIKCTVECDVDAIATVSIWYRHLRMHRCFVFCFVWLLHIIDWLSISTDLWCRRAMSDRDRVDVIVAVVAAPFFSFWTFRVGDGRIQLSNHSISIYNYHYYHYNRKSISMDRNIWVSLSPPVVCTALAISPIQNCSNE